MKGSDQLDFRDSPALAALFVDSKSAPYKVIWGGGYMFIKNT